MPPKHDGHDGHNGHSGFSGPGHGGHGGHGRKRTRYSVIIPVYQCERTLPACLAALRSQTVAPGEYEVIVVDNNSTDGSAALAGRDGQVRLLHETEQGAYAARNRALREARGEILMFTDPDCVPDPDWLEQAGAALAEQGVLVAVGPADACGPSRDIDLLSRYERHKDAYALGSNKPEAYYGHTNNMAVKRCAFDELGRFLHRERGADTIFVRRVVDRFGCGAVRYAPRMRVRHLEVDSAGAYFRKVRTYARSARGYSQVVPQRPLSSGERLRTYLSTVRSERLRPPDAARLLALLGIGMAHWRLGGLGADAWVGRRLGQPVRHESIEQCLSRLGLHDAGHLEVAHQVRAARNPLPENVASREDLPADAGWWGYAFRDVPQRRSGPTLIARIPDCRAVTCRDDRKRGDFYPAILTGPGHALSIREIRFRPVHARALRHSGPPVHFERATWITERVFHNHSHWLTAHLPKLLLLKKRNELDDVLLPAERSAAIDESMRLAGIDPAAFRTFRTGELLSFDELRVVSTDRFRPELLRLVPRAFGIGPTNRQAAAPQRRVYISRERAERRRLVNEPEVWRILEGEGFEKVIMEDLTFAEQVGLMRGAAVVVAPHGAGLSNMLFCPSGARVVEIGDARFPNPNFYAMACALGHRYWIVGAEPAGTGPPLERDMRVEEVALRTALSSALGTSEPLAACPV